jgi:PEP-CTERM/exosortase A-associated glycosyltransferase
MTLKVLHVLDHSVPLHSGYTFRTLAILKEQRRLGWDTVQLTSSKHFCATAEEDDAEGFHFYRTKVPDGGWRSKPILNQWAVIRDTEQRLEQVARQTQPDLLHAHSPCLNGISAIRVGRRLGVPVVYEMRASWEDAAVDHGTTKEGSPRYRLSRALETWTLRRADAVTTICEGLRTDILTRGIPAERVTVIPNAVNPDDFPMLTGRDDDLARQLGFEDTFVLGFIGSFYGYEGLDLLLDAVPRILEFEPRTRVLIVGGGPEESRLKVQAERLGIAERVKFTGRVPHRDVNRYYSVIDLLAFPRKSMRLTETVTPLKPLEAMAQGRLLIASDVGGHRELINDGVTGRLFRPNDPAALSEAVRAVLSDRDRWEKIKSAGRRFVENERNWRASVARYERVYTVARGAACHG